MNSTLINTGILDSLTITADNHILTLHGRHCSFGDNRDIGDARALTLSEHIEVMQEL